MSFILKALKKVEEEKAAASRPAPDLKSVLLAGACGKAKNGSRAVVFAAVLVVFVAGGVVTWWVVKKDPAAAPQAVRQTPESVIDAAPAPLPLPQMIAAQPQQKEPPPRAVAASVAVTPAPARTAAPAPPEPREHSGEVPPPPGLTLNGIAVQDDPDHSVEIVNGIMLKRGMTAQGGARVEKILPDRVRFSGNGGIFELQLPR